MPGFVRQMVLVSGYQRVRSSHTATASILGLGDTHSQHVGSGYEACASATAPLNDREQHELRDLIKELSSSPALEQPGEEHIIKALQVIRSMVRPIRKAQKKAKRESTRQGNAWRILPLAGHEHTTSTSPSPIDSRTITTQPHSSTTIPQLGCPLPLPLERAHMQAFRLLLHPQPNSQQVPDPLPIFPSRIEASVASVTRESLLRAQEALYDILRLRSTLTYWLHFAKVDIDKTQREELIKAIWKKERSEEGDLEYQDSHIITNKPIIDNGLERYTLYRYHAQASDTSRRKHVTAMVTVPRRPAFSWEGVFDGLSALKQDYCRDAYEAKGNIVSYTLCRGSGKEVSWVPKSWSQFNNVIVEPPPLFNDKTTSVPAEPLFNPTSTVSARSTVSFFTPSYAPVQNDLFTQSTNICASPSSTAGTAPRRSAGDDLLATATSLPGRRIPLEHLVQTNLLWEKNPVLSSNNGMLSRINGLPAFPPKIEWTSRVHAVRQMQAWKTVEKDLYTRFLDFVSSQVASSIPDPSLKEQPVRPSSYMDPLPVANFKSHAEIFAVKSGIGKDSSLAMSIWRSHWEQQSALLISTDGSSKTEDNASVGVHIGTATPVELKGALPREWAAQGSYTAEWFAICYALWLSLDLQRPANHLPNISGRSRLVFCTDSSGIITSITKPLRVHDKDASPVIKPWTNIVRLCRQMIVQLAKEGKDIKFTWMPRLSTIGLTRAHELADDVYGKIASSPSRPLKDKQTRQQCETVMAASSVK
ncbi:hypothetical protein QFC19_007609 [Naganishia cerealis]|uniref:Uncharacterized protein n=1 Tax=Naganishia cerealis TaxID=610337 RepID=A0ACC2V7M6_9TREE|nr:hypothetical protein QFC19_007609 [Naganishia cerealis]